MATYVPISTVDIIGKDIPLSILEGKKVKQVSSIYSEYTTTSSGAVLTFSFLLLDNRGLFLERVEDDNCNVFHSLQDLKTSRFAYEQIARVTTFVDAVRDVHSNEVILVLCLHLDIPGGFWELSDLSGPIPHILRNAYARHEALLRMPVVSETAFAEFAKSTGGSE